jgi:hypothetical protein
VHIWATPFGTFVETFVAAFIAPADFSLSAFQRFSFFPIL